MADIEVDCPCWVDVNLDAVANNTAEVKKYLGNVKLVINRP